MMKLIIEHDGAKREIVGAFNICGSKEDLLHLAIVINSHYVDSKGVYGWININDVQKSITNEPPISWREEAADGHQD